MASAPGSVVSSQYYGVSVPLPRGETLVSLAKSALGGGIPNSVHSCQYAHLGWFLSIYFPNSSRRGVTTFITRGLVLFPV